MNCPKPALALIVTLLLVPSLCLTQGVPGTNLVVHVRVTSIAISRDVTRITYVLKNDAGSRERLSTFIVNVPGPYSEVKWISRPSPQRNWMTHEKFGERRVVGWSVLGNQMTPGEESPELMFDAVGLPTIVTSWIEGYTPPSTEIPSDTLPLRDVAMVPDSTVGVEYDAVFQSPELLLIRLRRLATQACSKTLAWMTSAAVCIGLDTKLAAASERLRQADSPGARVQLRSFLTQLAAAHGPGGSVNDSAYWLLKANAGFILKQRF